MQKVDTARGRKLIGQGQTGFDSTARWAFLWYMKRTKPKTGNSLTVREWIGLFTDREPPMPPELLDRR